MYKFCCYFIFVAVLVQSFGRLSFVDASGMQVEWLLQAFILQGITPCCEQTHYLQVCHFLPQGPRFPTEIG